MIIPDSDLTHTVRVYSRAVSQGPENQPVYSYAFLTELPGLVVPMAARFSRDTREHVISDTMIFAAFARGIAEGQWVKCLDDSGEVVLIGEITQVDDPNLLHDHLELSVKKGSVEIDV